MRLCLNNWRAKQLTQTGFNYSGEFFRALGRLQDGHTRNTYYDKLVGLQK